MVEESVLLWVVFEVVKIRLFRFFVVKFTVAVVIKDVLDVILGLIVTVVYFVKL